MENKLKKLIGKTVIADLKFKEITGTVVDVNIEDYYFYEKNESIYITVNLKPLNGYESITNEEDKEEWSFIPLEYIRLK